MDIPPPNLLKVKREDKGAHAACGEKIKLDHTKQKVLAGQSYHVLAPFKLSTTGTPKFTLHRAADRMKAAARGDHGELCDNVTAEVIDLNRNRFCTGIENTSHFLPNGSIAISRRIPNLQL